MFDFFVKDKQQLDSFIVSIFRQLYFSSFVDGGQIICILNCGS